MKVKLINRLCYSKKGLFFFFLDVLNNLKSNYLHYLQFFKLSLEFIFYQLYTNMKKIKLLVFWSAFSLLFISCDPFHAIIEDEDNTVSLYESRNIQLADIDSTLKVVTWNVKFGGGRIDFFFDCHGDRVLMTEAEVLANMEGVAANVRHMNPDVLYLQEVDIDAKRSAYVDQVQYILDHSDLNYAIYASQWKADYVPSDGLGQMNSGNAILSKFPLDNAERVALPLIGEQSGLVQYFYLRRNILTADVILPSTKIALLNTHTSAYSTDGTKKQQLEIIEKRIAALEADGIPFVLGGDFNNLPANSTKYCEFNDDACQEGSGYETLSCEVLLEELENMKIYDAYQAAIPAAKYLANEAKYASFTSDKDGFWNRKLDYIFTNGQFVENSGLVHQDISTGGVETMPLSDHAPVSVEYKLN